MVFGNRVSFGTWCSALLFGRSEGQRRILVRQTRTSGGKYGRVADKGGGMDPGEEPGGGTWQSATSGYQHDTYNVTQ